MPLRTRRAGPGVSAAIAAGSRLDEVARAEGRAANARVRDVAGCVQYRAVGCGRSSRAAMRSVPKLTPPRRRWTRPFGILEQCLPMSARTMGRSVAIGGAGASW